MDREYLMQGELVLIVLILTFVGTLLYAKRASKKKRDQMKK
ncbi:amino acid ABC transporter permease [Brevibacillus humidisoli]|nr:amino acid ABC transporter permease [Brevibacillus humidisoli]UFJ39679.1 amino acid ABC transporter permease [Brevibacillus humidisoli]